MSVHEDFQQLVDDAIQAEAEIDHCPDLEPYLLAVLNYIKLHPENELHFRTYFSRLVATDSHGGQYLIPFCMRELRWPDVRQAATQYIESLQREKRHARYMNYFSDLMNTYDDFVWESADMFPYYATRELTLSAVPAIIDKLQNGTYQQQLNAAMALEAIGPDAATALAALKELLATSAQNGNKTLANFVKTAIDSIES